MESVRILAELLNTMKENPRRTYDFISENYHLLDKSELANLVKELLYSIHSFCSAYQAAEMLAMAADELEYQYKEDFDDM